MENHHISSSHFFLKLRQTLLYLGMDPDAGTKKKKRYFQKNKSYTQNRDFVRSLQDAGFIPFSEVDKDIFWI